MNKRKRFNKTMALILSSALTITGIALPMKSIVSASGDTHIGRSMNTAIMPSADDITVKGEDIIETTSSVADQAKPDFKATFDSNPANDTSDLKVLQGDALEFIFTVTAPEDAAQEDFPAFTATLTSLGGFWGSGASTGEDDSWKVTVNAPGEYAIHVTAPTDWEFSGTFCVTTDLTALPSGYAISGKTAKLGPITYDWSTAKTYISSDYICLGIWNEWAVDENGNPHAGSNPLYYSKNINDILTATVNEFGDYTLKMTATQDADSDKSSFYVSTDLDQIPLQYSIVGKTVKIGDKIYDWSKAVPCKSDGINLFLWDRGSSDTETTPIDEHVIIKRGDVIEITFSVLDTPKTDPDFTATLTSGHSIWDTNTPQTQTRMQVDPTQLSIKEGDALEFHFTVTALTQSAQENFPSFTATLASYGGFWGWNSTPPEDDAWKIEVNAPGEYAFSVTAPANWDFSGSFCIDTNLTELPRRVAITGKTATLGKNTYDWHTAKAYKEGDHIRLGIWNEWGADINGKWSILSTPLAYKYTEAWMEEAWIAAEEWETTVKALGDQTVSGIATQNATSRSGALSVITDLPEIPKGFSVSGKTVNIAGKSYDWSRAALYTSKNGKLALSLWDAEDGTENANTLGEEIEIKAGDRIEATFTIQKNDIPLQTPAPTDTPIPTGTQEPTDTQKPTGTPNPADTQKPTGTPNPVGTQKPTGTPNPADTQEPTGTPNPTSTQKPDKTPDNNQKPSTPKKPAPLAKNKTFTSGSLKYKVTAAAKKNIPAQVSVIGLSPSGKKASSINVKNIVSYSHISYTVTAISSKAFKNSAKLKKATLGSNIRSMPANAFSGCKKLTSITAPGITKIGQRACRNCTALKKLILRKRISVKKGAFKGCKKTIKVTGSSKKINKANVKKLKKCGYKKFK